MLAIEVGVGFWLWRFGKVADAVMDCGVRMATPMASSPMLKLIMIRLVSQ